MSSAWVKCGDSSENVTALAIADSRNLMSNNTLSKVWFTPTRGASNWLWLSFFVVVIDQATKALVVGVVKMQNAIQLLPILDIVYLENTGAAFSILAQASGWQRWFFILLALAVSVALMIWLRRIRADQTILAVGLALVLGGALGNVFDRVIHGFVVDFIYFHWGTWYFPAFNIADSAISIGAGCLLLDAFRESGHEKKGAHEQAIGDSKIRDPSKRRT
jgi:signal peptidase II